MRGLSQRGILVAGGLCAVLLAGVGCYDFNDVGPPDLAVVHDMTAVHHDLTAVVHDMAMPVDGSDQDGSL